MATIIHNPAANFVYVRFNENRISHSVEWSTDILVDVTDDDEIVGIQLQLPTKAEIHESSGCEEDSQVPAVAKELRLVHA